MFQAFNSMPDPEPSAVRDFRRTPISKSTVVAEQHNAMTLNDFIFKTPFLDAPLNDMGKRPKILET